MNQILYTSTAVVPFKQDELQQLLEVARRNNSSKSITGMLLYCNSNFIQLLEGEQDHIDELFSLICLDGRHKDVVKIMESSIETPQFPDWSMGYKSLTTQQLRSIDKHQNADLAKFIRSTQPFKLLRLMSANHWN